MSDDDLPFEEPKAALPREVRGMANQLSSNLLIYFHTLVLANFFTLFRIRDIFGTDLDPRIRTSD